VKEKKEKRWWYVARRETLDDLPVPTVMDMLRYDQARVELNAPKDWYLLSKVEEGGYPRPNSDRWPIRIYILGKSVEPPTHEEIYHKVAAQQEAGR